MPNEELERTFYGDKYRQVPRHRTGTTKEMRDLMRWCDARPQGTITDMTHHVARKKYSKVHENLIQVRRTIFPGQENFTHCLIMRGSFFLLHYVPTGDTGCLFWQKNHGTRDVARCHLSNR